MKQELNIYRKQVECLIKMNCKLQSDLDKSVNVKIYLILIKHFTIKFHHTIITFIIIIH